MFVGHLAVSLGTKALAPRVPLGTLLLASFGIDLIWPVLLLIDAESVVVSPGNTAFTPLLFESYPWSHSLLMVVLWGSIAGGLVYIKARAWSAGIVVGTVVVSHWILDFVTHRPDLPLWPGGPQVGLGLWNSIPGTLLIEGSLLVTGLVLYCRQMRSKDRIGNWSLWLLVILTGGFWVTQPWAPPPPSATAVTGTALGLWVLPPWGNWIERHRRLRSES
jgi:membrane-bound metal-dependent hydrolase YbcI (DUF457 family)